MGARDKFYTVLRQVRNGKWRAEVSYESFKMELGYFMKKEDAEKAIQKAKDYFIRREKILYGTSKIEKSEELKKEKLEELKKEELKNDLGTTK